MNEEHTGEYWELIKICGHIADVLQHLANGFVAENMVSKLQGVVTKSFVEGQEGSSGRMNRLQELNDKKKEAFRKSLIALNVLFQKGLQESERLIKYEEQRNG